MNFLQISICILLLFLVKTIRAQEAKIETPIASNTCSNLKVQFRGLGTATGTSFTFNGGTLPAGWSSTPYQVGQPCNPSTGNSPDNTNYFWATTLDNDLRYVITNQLDCSLGGVLEFYLRFGNDDPQPGCEEADPGEGVHVQYKTASGTWTDIAYIDPSSYHSWTHFSYQIPDPAKTTSTSFRWYQTGASGDEYDNWGIEDLIVTVNKPIDSYTWNFGDGSTSTHQNPVHTFLSSGTKTVSLTISSAGKTDTETIHYTITENGTPSFSTSSSETIIANGGEQSIPLSGISDGDDCIIQNLTITAISSNPSLVGNPKVDYTSLNTTGNLLFTPEIDQVGHSVITIKVEDDGNNTGGLAKKKSSQRTLNLYVNDQPTDPGAFTFPANTKFNIDSNYNISWGQSTDRTSSVTYRLEYRMNNTGIWNVINSNLSSNTYNSWGGHKNSSYVGNTLQFRVRASDGTYSSPNYTYSSSYEIINNSPPIATNDGPFYVYPGATITKNVTTNDSDPDGNTISVASWTALFPNIGTISSSQNNGIFSYIAPTSSNKNYSTNVTFHYDLTDSQATATARVSISIVTPTWNGTANYSTGGNWNGAVVPLNAKRNDIIIKTGQVTISDTREIRHLTIEKDAILKVASQGIIHVYGDLDNKNLTNGKIIIEKGGKIILHGNYFHNGVRKLENSTIIDLGASIDF
ncbi:hypothetical protein EMN47_14235 [Prolixibacteraceae bacterium JC049]|nr:hypothetical protein [Prolixibacteraceae bacterium JC049]